MKIMLSIFVIFTAIINYLHALGGDAEKVSYSYYSENKRFILVMIPDFSLKEELEYIEGLFASDTYKQKRKKETISLRETFKKNGVYDAKTNKLVWAVSWYLPLHMQGYILSNDGTHLIIIRKSFNKSDKILSFYEKGRPINEYSINDLMTFPYFLRKLVHDGYEWLCDDRSAYDPISQELTIRTIHHEQYTFDKNGNIIHKSSPINLIFHLLVTGTLIFFAIVFYKSHRSNLVKSGSGHI